MVFRACFLFCFFEHKFVYKQLAPAKIVSKLNRKNVRVPAMTRLNDFSKASKLSDYQTLSVNNKNKLKVGIEKARK